MVGDKERKANLYKHPNVDVLKKTGTYVQMNARSLPQEINAAEYLFEYLRLMEPRPVTTLP
jgi:hypothetical protein